MTTTQTTAQRLSDELRGLDSLTDRTGVPIAVDAIVAVHPKDPWAQPLAGRVGRVTHLLATGAAKPVWVTIPGQGALLRFALDEIEVVRHQIQTGQLSPAEATAA